MASEQYGLIRQEKALALMEVLDAVKATLENRPGSLGMLHDTYTHFISIPADTESSKRFIDKLMEIINEQSV